MVEQKPNNNQQLYYVGIAVVVVVTLIALWLLLGKDPQPQLGSTQPPLVTEAPVQIPQPEPEAVTEPEPEPTNIAIAPEPAAAVPEPLAQLEVPLPVLDESDPDVKQRLLALDWRAGLAGLFVTDDVLRNFTVQIDNIAQGQLATGHVLLKPLEQSFSVVNEDNMQLDNSSFVRYQPYIQLLESVPPRQIVQLFNHYEPLLQQAYAEQGYPDELFKNKLIAAIDQLLATPEVEYPLALQRPSVVYIFADPAIEQLPAAQKQMIRLGPDNQKRLKALLEQYKQQLQ